MELELAASSTSNSRRSARFRDYKDIHDTPTHSSTPVSYVNAVMKSIRYSSRLVKSPRTDPYRVVMTEDSGATVIVPMPQIKHGLEKAALV